ncbi:MAG: type I restriction-modification system subunit M N-terminal domain-containing protein, partial [candidate division WOR-3 bacterium]
MAKDRQIRQNSNSATLGFETRLWQAADRLRGMMDAAEYKHVVLGLLFLKFISDAFQERFDFLARETADPRSEWFAKDKMQ